MLIFDWFVYEYVYCVYSWDFHCKYFPFPLAYPYDDEVDLFNDINAIILDTFGFTCSSRFFFFFHSRNNTCSIIYSLIQSFSFFHFFFSLSVVPSLVLYHPCFLPVFLTHSFYLSFLYTLPLSLFHVMSAVVCNQPYISSPSPSPPFPLRRRNCLISREVTYLGDVLEPGDGDRLGVRDGDGLPHHICDVGGLQLRRELGLVDDGGYHVLHDLCTYHWNLETRGWCQWWRERVLGINMNFLEIAVIVIRIVKTL